MEQVCEESKASDKRPLEVKVKKSEKLRTKDIELDENVTFADLQLSKPVLDGLRNAAFYKPSPIQLKAIPLGKLGLGNFT